MSATCLLRAQRLSRPCQRQAERDVSHDILIHGLRVFMIGNFGNKDIQEYLEGCRFLPKLNNELPNQRNSTYKERLGRLQNLVLIMFEHDTILIPRETAWFGYYPDGTFTTVLPPQQTTLYTEDWIGLKALDEAGRVKYLTVQGNHLRISRDDMKKYIVPYLEDGPPIFPKEKLLVSQWGEMTPVADDHLLSST
ncbi:hypothetical protein ZIOFF_045740 [Zingiber officinale]|uniref:Palmitoyl-protein thioesterase n=1 Tax=Zingiber officinale TaxID=94328 RepID=A0A8J5G4C5_ZINOF|nr:hypothetical protein ZIOFF_045740 [Zingiber officinale]